MIDMLESALRIAGGVGLLAAWVIAGTAAARGRHRPPGRGFGLAPRLGALVSYLLVAVPYFTVWVVLWSPLPGTPPGWLRLGAAAVGALLGSCGLALYLWGRFTLGDMYNVSSSLGTELFAGHQLVTAGPFRYVRHPMYVGIGLAAIGGLAIYRTWTMVFAVASVAGLSIKARREEQLLAAEFGPAWADYAGRVTAWWPRIPTLRRVPVPREGGMRHE
jgi:protein-S-isoprenylcysteine O-methyltransferase Ste14